MQQFYAILLFYKPFFSWSCGINFLLLLLGFEIIPLFLVKMFLVIILWFFITESTVNRQLTLYKKLGISTLKLLVLFFVIDVLLSIPFLLIVKVFI